MIRSWISAPERRETAVREHDHWIANELLGRGVVFGLLPAGQQAAAVSDLDRFAPRVALTKES